MYLLYEMCIIQMNTNNINACSYHCYKQ